MTLYVRALTPCVRVRASIQRGACEGGQRAVCALPPRLLSQPLPAVPPHSRQHGPHVSPRSARPTPLHKIESWQTTSLVCSWGLVSGGSATCVGTESVFGLTRILPKLGSNRPSRCHRKRRKTFQSLQRSDPHGPAARCQVRHKPLVSEEPEALRQCHLPIVLTPCCGAARTVFENIQRRHFEKVWPHPTYTAQSLASANL
eukprot:3737325-Rhodomonas_salina.2